MTLVSIKIISIDIRRRFLQECIQNGVGVVEIDVAVFPLLYLRKFQK